jgi:DNA-binding MarR family transcriptional regulator
MVRIRTISHRKLNVKIPASMEKSPLFDLYLRPGFLLRRANQIAMSINTRECEKLGLTPPQHACLIALDQLHGSDQRGLGKALGIDRVTIGQVLRGLEARGLIRRKGSHTDGRRNIVTLTAEGRELVVPAMEAIEATSERILSALEAKERRAFVELLLKVVVALNEESATPVEPPIR